MKVCSSDRCERDYYARGFCKLHYNQRLSSGELKARTQATRGAPEAFLMGLKGHQGQACVVWPYGLDSGYGALNVNGLPKRAHRAMCFLAHGDPPFTDADAAHSCGNSRCVNPNHLRWATAAENANDTKLHGRFAQGADHAKASLTPEQVRLIRSSGPGTSNILARSIGCTGGTVRRVRRGETYRNVPPPAN